MMIISINIQVNSHANSGSMSSWSMSTCNKSRQQHTFRETTYLAKDRVPVSQRARRYVRRYHTSTVNNWTVPTREPIFSRNLGHLCSGLIKLLWFRVTISIRRLISVNTVRDGLLLLLLNRKLTEKGVIIGRISGSRRRMHPRTTLQLLTPQASKNNRWLNQDLAENCP